MQYDPNATSPIDRDELRALVRRARDVETHLDRLCASKGRADDVVVHRHAVTAWLDSRR